MGKQRKRNRVRQSSTSRDAMTSNSEHQVPQVGTDALVASDNPLAPAAEHAPSASGASQADRHESVAAPPTAAASDEPTTEPSAEGAPPADTSSYVPEGHREAIASILKSLTGNTLQGVADVNAASDRTRRELIGQRVNNYEIIGLVSSGGMGDVFEAIHLVIHRKVAIKVLRPEHCGDPALVQRFFNEARAANTIRHPNIVEVLDVGMLPGGLPYIAMERLEGETLAQRLSREGRLDIERAVDFAVQAASALQAAHKRGIVHRDLKPDNLFVVPDPRLPGHELIKVLDFGIAKLHGDRLSQVKTNVGSILGTPPYMSPEQCRGIPDGVDHRSDVYALGVILFEMLCGAPPFVAEGVGDVMVMHLSSPPPLPTWRRQDIPLRIEQTILWAMEKNPDQRIPSMGDFIFTLGNGPTPVPYIVTPTGLTTADLPPIASVTPSGLVPRYSAPAISLEGEFPIDETGTIADEAGYRSPSVPAAAESEPALQQRSSRTSMTPASPTRASWRSGAIGAIAMAAAISSVAGFNHLRSVGEVPTPTRSGESERPKGMEATGGERGLEVTTAALEALTTHVQGQVQGVTHSTKPDSVVIADVVPDRTLPNADVVPNELTIPLEHPEEKPENRSATTLTTPAPRWGGRPRGAAARHVSSRAAATEVGGVPSTPSSSNDEDTVRELPFHGGAASDSPAIEPRVEPLPPVLPEALPADPPAPSPGTLHFDSAPWARVSLDGRILGVTPLRGVVLPAGIHHLRLENSELGISQTVVVEIKPGQSVSRFVGWEQRP